MRPPLEAGRIRRPGSGRPEVCAGDPTLLDDLRKLVEPVTRGDPMRLLMWVSKSRKKLAAALAELGHSVCPNSVGKLLGKLGYSRQGNRKALEGRQHADRDAQFRHINARVQAAQSAGEPVIDTKKKELVGRFKNAGTDYRPQGEPDPVDVHDFPDKALGKVVPYGIYDVAEDEGWVSLGITHDTAEFDTAEFDTAEFDTAEFAVHAIARWHERMGRARYPNAERLLITADCGGSNAPRGRLWKRELQRFADETGLTVEVCHYPPGTSKWNKIEHRLFCRISQTWRGRPLVDRLTVVDLIASTTTTTGLTVACELDERSYDKGIYDKGIKITKAEMCGLDIEADAFHPEWNYTVKPRPKTQQL